MSDVPVGSVSISVVPDARGWNERAQKQIVEPSRQVGEEAGTEMSNAMTRKLGEGGDTAGGAFEKTLKARLRVAMDSLPKAQLGANTTELDVKLDEIRLKINEVRKQKVIDVREAAVDVDLIMKDIVELELWAKTQKIEIPIDAKFNIDKSLKTLSSIRGVGPTGATTGGLLSPLFDKSVANLTSAVGSLDTAASSISDTVGSLTGVGNTVQDIVKNTTGGSRLLTNMFKGMGSGLTSAGSFGQRGISNIASGVMTRAGWAPGAGAIRNLANVSGFNYIPGATKITDQATRMQQDINSSLRDLSRAFSGIRSTGLIRSTARATGFYATPGDKEMVHAIESFVAATKDMTKKVGTAVKDFGSSVSKFSSSVANITKTVGSVVGRATGVSQVGGIIGKGVKGIFGRGGGKDIVQQVDDAVQFAAEDDINSLTKLISARGGGEVGKFITTMYKGNVEAFLDEFARAGGNTTQLFRRLGIKSAEQQADEIEKAVTAFTEQGMGDVISKVIGGAGGGGGRDLRGILGDYAGGGGDVGKLLQDIGGMGGGVAKDVTAAGEGGAGGSGGLLSTITGIIPGIMSAIGPILIAAVIAAAPFIGQMIGGALITVLGGGLAAMGVAGAIMSGQLTKPFQIFAADMKVFMDTIGKPMIPVIQSVLSTLEQTIKVLTPVITTVEDVISKALGPFLNAIAKSFASPTVQASMKAVGSAFADILNAVTPQIGPSMDGIAKSIKGLADTLAKNPQAMADMFHITTNLVSFIIDSLTALTKLSNWVEGHWNWVKDFLHLPGSDTGQATTAPIKTLPASSLTAATNKAIAERLKPTNPKDFVSYLPTSTKGNPLYNVPANQWFDIPGQTGGVLWNPATQQTALGVTFKPGGLTPFSAQRYPNKPGVVQAGADTAAVAANIGNVILSAFSGASKVVGKATSALGIGTVPGQKGSNPWLMNDITSWFTGQNPSTATGKGSPQQTGADIVKGVTAGAQKEAQASGAAIGRQVTDPYLQHINTGFGTHSPSTKTIPTGKDIVGGIMQGMETATANIAPWMATWVVAPILTALTGDAYGFGMSNAGTTAGMQPSQQTVKIGWGIVDGIKEGITEEMIGIDTWAYSAIVQPIISYLTGPNGFKIQSPSKTTKPIGKQIVEGIISGMVDTAGHIGDFVAKVFGGWPRAIQTFISKGLNPSKLRGSALTTYEKALGIGTMPKNYRGGISAWLTSGGLGPSKSPAGGATGTEMQNGKQLYQYLLTNLFHGNKIAAAGATASIWGESSWNPFAVGTGGRGLIGWTPEGTISNAAFSGGMKTQLPAIIDFVYKSGDTGAIAEMLGASSVLSAANIWGKKVERYGINDVHPTGVRLASSFMDQGGWLPTGATMVYNMTGKPELVLNPDQIAASMGNNYHAHFDGLTGSAIESHVRTAFQLMSMTEGNLYRQGRRS